MLRHVHCWHRQDTARKLRARLPKQATPAGRALLVCMIRDDSLHATELGAAPMDFARMQDCLFPHARLAPPPHSPI